MKNRYLLFLLLSSIAMTGQSLELKGVIDFDVPEGGSDGKAIHLYVIDDIADLSLYSIGVANNGGGTDGEEYTFPVMAASAGDHILLPRNISIMTNYLESLNQFDIVIEADVASQNGDDAIELFFNGSVIETFGDIDCRPSEDGVTTVCPNYEYYEDAWAYKNEGIWTFASAQCTDDSSTSRSSSCPYPFLDPNLSTTKLQNPLFSIYPNPVTQGEITFQTPVSGTKNILLYDLNGRKVFDKTTLANTVDVSQLQQGFYVLQLRSNNQVQTAKLIIK